MDMEGPLQDNLSEKGSLEKKNTAAVKPSLVVSQRVHHPSLQRMKDSSQTTRSMENMRMMKDV